MQLSVSFPNSEFQEIIFTATEKSTVRDVLQTAEEEWNVDTELLEISLAGEKISNSDLLLSVGVEVNSELVVSAICVFNKQNLSDETFLNKIRTMKKQNNDDTIIIDASTFTEDGCLSCSLECIPSAICVFTNSNSVTTIANTFLSDGNSANVINTIDLSSLCNVTTIGDYFLYRNAMLEYVNITGLRSLTDIGSSFLGYTSIGEIDLSSLKNITEIKDRFLENCSLLSALLNISSLRNVTKIGDMFLSNCYSLETIDLSELTKLVDIGSFFVCESECLKTINISSFDNVNRIGIGFLAHNVSLQSVDISYLKNVTEIDVECRTNRYFLLENCDDTEVLGLETLAKDSIVRDALKERQQHSKRLRIMD